ncbi:carbohydrate ABC transporter permease [Candidatus Poriferisodalis sp.]|uniref:carbohydrate ABC transporter permease n=1 Tax=Candidatus Poriferisodalis sp. TaxID=3101277 RepID=UPI003B014C3D
MSISNWATLKEDLSIRDPVLGNYADIFQTARFQADIRNTIVFTALFLALAVVVGLGAAILLEQKVRGRKFFRNVILFPYAISMVVTGVVWRWIFNPEAGVNLLFDVTGFNSLLQSAGVGELQPGWTTDPNVWFQVNGVVERVLPFGDEISVQLGIPAAIVPVAIAASWQVSGFVMAMYIGGMATVPESVREAARIDGASEWQVYRRVVIPMMRPVTITVLVILLHISLKTFDLVVAMAGPGPGFATDLPSLYVFETMFRATRYNAGTAAAIVVLLFTVIVIVPYLVRSARADQ